MNLQIDGQQIDVTPALREYVQTKLEKIERQFDPLIDAHVVLKIDGGPIAEATINGAGGTFHAEASASDMYAAIDALLDKLDRQTKRFREKQTNHHRGQTPNFG